MMGRLPLPIVLLALLNFWLFASTLANDAPPVKVQLRAPWKRAALAHNGSALLLEVFEAANARSADCFFPLVTKLTAPWNAEASSDRQPSSHHRGKAHLADAGPVLADLSDRQVLDTAEQAILQSQLFGTDQEAVDASLQLWHTSLALHDQTPRVQAFVQLYHTLKLDQRWIEKAKTWRDGPEACLSWVDLHGQVLCDEDEVVTALRQAATAPGKQRDPVRLLPFDHVLPRRSSQKPVASRQGGNGSQIELVLILYGDPYSSNFWKLHSLLEAYATGHREVPGHSGRISYVLRWRPYPAQLNDSNRTAQEATVAADRHSTIFLGSYGAYLDLKKVDYLVIDDRKLRDDSDVGQAVGDDGDQQSTFREETSSAEEARAWLDEAIGESIPSEEAIDADHSKRDASGLTSEQLGELGLLATHLVVSASDPLEVLEQLSQNFPLYAERLARSKRLASVDFEELISSLISLTERRLQPGSSELWLNGKGLEDQELSPLSLIKTLEEERSLVRPLMGKLAGSVLDKRQAVDLLASTLLGRAYAAASSAEDATSAFFDASDRIERQRFALPDDQKQAADGTAGETGKGEAIDVGAITWWNDLTQGKTANWSKDLINLLRPMWPGQFPQLSLNLFNVIVVLDLSKRESCVFLAESIGPSLGRIGLRWGFVPGGLEGPNDRDSDSARIARLFWEVFDLGGPQAATRFLRKLASSKAGGGDRVDAKVARNEASMVLHGHLSPIQVEARLAEVVEGRVERHRRRETMVRSYIERLRATEAESTRGHVFVNGQHIPFNSQLIHMLHQAVQEQIQTIAPSVYHRELTSETENLETYFYDLPGSLRFRSRLIFPPDSLEPGQKAIAFSHADIVSALDGLQGQDAHVEVLTRYLYPSSDGPARFVNATLWVIGDLDSAQGAQALQNVVEAQSLAVESEGFRLGFLHVPSVSTPTEDFGASGPPLSAFLHRLMRDGSIERLTPVQLLDSVRAYVPARDDLDQTSRFGSGGKNEQQVFSEDRNAAAGAAAEKGWSVHASEASHKFWQAIGRAVVETIGVDPERGPALLVHGKIVQGFEAHEVGPDDVLALVSVESVKKVAPVLKALSGIVDGFEALEARSKADLVSAVTSVVSRAYAVDASKEGVFVKPNQPRTALIETIGSEHHVFEVGDRASATLRFSVVLDPISEAAQKWSTILKGISRLQGVYIRVVLNPRLAYSEMPLKRFYRFSAPMRLRFDDQGHEVAEELRFLGLPESAVLTLGLDVPPAWLTMPEEAIYDLDNIRLSDVPLASRSRGVKAIYELKHILIEGHARDVRGATPRGLQLALETPDGSYKLDTIVMANLAYFQFKAQPGLWNLAIRSGRSSELYEMVSVGNLGWESPGVDVTGNDITLDTFGGLKIYPVVQKRKGMEREDLLEELDAQGRPIRTAGFGGGRKEQGGMLRVVHNALGMATKAVSRVADLVKGGESTSVTQTPHAEINIFTVASGHLYERMAYIMILSVLKHTQSSVKFWFIENFLSPSFKELIPHLAEEYGFRYELVTYAWPHWLRPQREKQRTIWGYKILFLDTLFPLDLGKVIFVDADQVVRTDLKELVELDLDGAVYAYPPMGDDSDDMDGFRFWKHGYWKDHLRGRPYHISALYAVDLHRFRRVAAGDKLRGQYQALSADPASLANLDQDLPNNLQATLPIFTLEREWLWCETWCSAEWLGRAKTIDLCSNPKTKEPKLERARRQIPEWSVYDREVQRVAARVAARGEGRSLVSPLDVVGGGAEGLEQEVGTGGEPAHDEL